MKPFTKQSFFALATLALLSSCSRPYATFQKTTPEHFYTKAPVTPAAGSETPIVVPAAEGMPTAAVAPTPATVSEALDQLEAVASAKAGPSESRKLTKRVARIRTLMAAIPTKTAVTVSTTAPKLNLMQRLAMKSIDKKIQKKMAPKQPMASTGILTIGAVLVIVGLVLILATTSKGLGGGIAIAGAIVLLIGLL